MADWKTVRLGDVCLIERGGSPRPIEDFITEDEDGINWIKIGDTNESKYITKTEQKIKKEGMKKSRFVQEGDFLLSNSMSFGRPYILKINGCIHDGWLVIRDENNTFDKDYLYYYLSSPIMYQHFKSLAVGGVVNNLNSNMVRNVEVPLPPIETQRQIAANLDKVTHTIDLCNAILEKLDLLVKSRFVEMFGTLESPASNFEYDTLKNLCYKITDGKHGGCTFEEGTSFYFVGAREIYDDTVHYETAPEITEEEFYKDYKRCNVEVGDFLIVNTGATIGKSAIATDDRTEHTLLQKSVALMKTKKDKLLPIFLMYCYKVNDRMYKVESASAQPNLLLSKINATKIYVPSLDLQHQFAAFVEQTDKSKSAVKQVLEKAETLKKALMQEYFG